MKRNHLFRSMRCVTPLWLVFVLFMLTGCVSFNSDPDILLKEPYNRVTYVEHTDLDRYETIDVIQVTTRGWQAGILSTIPQLFEKALEKNNKQAVAVGRIDITTFVRQETYKVPYRECDPFSSMMGSSRAGCASGACGSISVGISSQQRHCWTEFRTEVREVIYQKAIADILRKRD